MPTLLMGIFSLLQTTRSSSGKAFVLILFIFFPIEFGSISSHFCKSRVDLGTQLQLVRQKMQLNSFPLFGFHFFIFYFCLLVWLSKKKWFKYWFDSSKSIYGPNLLRLWQYYCHNLRNSDYEYLRNLDTCLFNKLINFEFFYYFNK